MPLCTMDRSGNGGWAKLWSVTEDKGTYAFVNLSTWIVDEAGKYKTDFADKYVVFFGKAYKKLKEITIPDKGVYIRIEPGCQFCRKDPRTFQPGYSVSDFIVAKKPSKKDFLRRG